MPSLSSRLALLAATAGLVLVSACSSAEDAASDGEDTTSAESTAEPTTDEETTAAEPTQSEETESEETESEETESEETEEPDEGDVEGTGYTIALPEGWTDVTEEAAASQPLVDLAIAEPSGTFRTNFNVVKPQPFTGTEEQLVTQSAKELKSVTNSKVTPVDPTTFDGVTALGQTSTLSTGQDDVMLIQYMVVRDEQIHPVTMTFLAENEGEATAVMEEIIASWQWQ
jgi:hypothetical protein